MHTGHIICLNGVTSAGKTTIAKEIQDMSDLNYYHVSLDMFEQMASIHSLAKCRNCTAQNVRSHSSAYFCL